MTKQSLTIDLKLAQEGDFNYVNDKGIKKPRFGFIYWVKEHKEMPMKRLVFDHRTDRVELKLKINRGFVWVLTPTHPDNHLPGNPVYGRG